MGETNPQAPMQGAAGPSPLPARAKKPIVFGKYELLERYRVGGMAEVWTAKRLGSGDDPIVALKRILPSFTDEADYLAMFRDEARLAQQLSHPCIVTAFEVGQVDDAPYIVLEYVSGQNVAALIRKARERAQPVPVSAALRIAIDVCRALEYAHGLTDALGTPLGLVHRDVSPSNILLGYDGAVKLIDFGIAKSSEQLMRTQAGLLKGKHGYLSPEQASGAPVDARSDLFSLAICVWEMLAAKRLFLGASDFSSVVRVREAVVPPIGEAGAPEAIERVLQRALARDPGERHASATELREALEAAAAEAGIAPATEEELASELREVFADELALEASSEAIDAPAPYEGTGLLDAFDDLEPVSTVSTLAALPEPPDEANASDDDVEDDLDLTEVSATGPEPDDGALEAGSEAASFELHREPEDDARFDGGDITEQNDPPSLELSGEEPVSEERASEEPASEEAASDEPALEAAAANASDEAQTVIDDVATVAAAVEPESDTLESPAPVEDGPSASSEGAIAEAGAPIDTDGDDLDEPTRVVSYRSIESGELAAQQAAAAAANAQPASEPTAAQTMPGMGDVMWDDEELSTHLYDGPSMNAALDREPLAIEGGASPQSARPSVAPFSSRPSAAPFSSRPPAPLSSRAPIGPGSVPPPPALGTAAAAPTTQRPPANTPAWLLPALIAGAAVVVLIALSMFRSGAPGTIHLTTEPPDSRVTFNGKVLDSTLSPFVIASVEPGERHSIEVAREGYRTWSTHLSLASGQTLQLPEIVLVPVEGEAPTPRAESVAPAMPAAAAEPAAPAAAPAAQPKASQEEPAPPVERQRVAPSRQPEERAASNDARPPSARPQPVVTPTPTPQVVAAPVAAGSDTGMLRVNSMPWAQVHVDGRLVGNTPQMALRLSPGRHTVLLVNPDLGMRKQFTVQIKRGQVTTKVVELAR